VARISLHFGTFGDQRLFRVELPKSDLHPQSSPLCPGEARELLALVITAVRRYQSRGGISMNLEQNSCPMLVCLSALGSRTASNDRSDDEHRLPRERKADAFQADETGDDEEAVDVNEVRDGWHGDRPGSERWSMALVEDTRGNCGLLAYGCRARLTGGLAWMAKVGTERNRNLV